MHKPKKEWNLEGKLCGDCHVDKTKEYYEGKARQPCVTCGTSYKITDLWEPRWQWDMEGLLPPTALGTSYARHVLIKKKAHMIRRKIFVFYVEQRWAS